MTKIVWCKNRWYMDEYGKLRWVQYMAGSLFPYGLQVDSSDVETLWHAEDGQWRGHSELGSGDRCLDNYVKEYKGEDRE